MGCGDAEPGDLGYACAGTPGHRRSAAAQWGGAGTALVDAVRGVAARAGCRTLWVLTTNDNVDGLRFYQRRGFRLSALRPGAVDESRRTLKPQIPPVGFHGGISFDWV